MTEATTSTTLYSRDISRQHRPTSMVRSERYDRGGAYDRGQRSDRYDRKSDRYDRGRGSPYGRDTRTERYIRGDSGERERSQNPRGADGRIRRCYVCESIRRYVYDCPALKELKSDYQKKKNDGEDRERDHEVNYSW